jgi:hypothetical protein
VTSQISSVTTRDDRKGLADGLDAAAVHFRRAVLPLYTIDERGYPKTVGTGVFFKIGSTPFLISAAHVLDLAPKEVIYIGGELLTAMTGRLTHTNTSQRDLIDVSICELHAKTVEYLGRVQFLSVGDVDRNHVLNYVKPHPYLAFGFPISKQPKTKDGIQDAYPMLIGTRLAPLSAFKSEKLDPNHSLLFDFDMENVETRDGSGRAPAPHGISGGPVWDTWHFHFGGSKPKLVGIIIERRGPERQWLLATSMDTILEMLVRRYPELRTDLPSYSPHMENPRQVLTEGFPY